MSAFQKKKDPGESLSCSAFAVSFYTGLFLNSYATVRSALERTQTIQLQTISSLPITTHRNVFFQNIIYQAQAPPTLGYCCYVGQISQK